MQLNLWPKWRTCLLLAIFWLWYSWWFKYHSFDKAHFYHTLYNLKVKNILHNRYKITEALTHKTSRIIGISANLSINLDQALHHDLSNFTISQGVLQPITEEDNQRERFPEFVWPSRWSGGIHTPKFVQHPCFRRIKTLKMLLWTTSLKKNFIMQYYKIYY